MKNFPFHQNMPRELWPLPAGMWLLIVDLYPFEETVRKGGVLIWSLVPDNQNPNWGPIQDGQTPGWTPVNDTQSSGWAPISDNQTSGWVAVPDSQSPNWGTIPT